MQVQVKHLALNHTPSTPKYWTVPGIHNQFGSQGGQRRLFGNMALTAGAKPGRGSRIRSS